ncbi:MAG TPA: hypothetical protein VLM78_06625 [Anaerolineales bacterium]|nr:hypothetical protein [Anaerolineales bacterium]
MLILTAWNAIRLGASITDWNLLAEFAPHPGPLYILVSASFWTLGGIALWIMLRRRSPRSQSASAIFMLGYAAWWWTDRLLLQTPNPNWPFALVLTIALLALAAADIFSRKTTNYFSQRETHEQTTADQDSK